MSRFATCAITHLPIESGTRAALLVIIPPDRSACRVDTEHWRMLAPPILGTYDEYGVLKPDDTMDPSLRALLFNTNGRAVLKADDGAYDTLPIEDLERSYLRGWLDWRSVSLLQFPNRAYPFRVVRHLLRETTARIYPFRGIMDSHMTIDIPEDQRAEAAALLEGSGFAFAGAIGGRDFIAPAPGNEGAYWRSLLFQGDPLVHDIGRVFIREDALNAVCKPKSPDFAADMLFLQKTVHEARKHKNFKRWILDRWHADGWMDFRDSFRESPYRLTALDPNDLSDANQFGLLAQLVSTPTRSYKNFAPFVQMCRILGYLTQARDILRPIPDTRVLSAEHVIQRAALTFALGRKLVAKEEREEKGRS